MKHELRGRRNGYFTEPHEYRAEHDISSPMEKLLKVG